MVKRAQPYGPPAAGRLEFHSTTHHVHDIRGSQHVVDYLFAIRGQRSIEGALQLFPARQHHQTAQGPTRVTALGPAPPLSQ